MSQMGQTRTVVRERLGVRFPPKRTFAESEQPQSGGLAGSRS